MVLPDIVLILIWSVLSEDMAKDGYKDIVNIDISSVVIEQMREKHKEITQLTCSVF
jgi:EEF1A lysine methyltransferase 4